MKKKPVKKLVKKRRRLPVKVEPLPPQPGSEGDRYAWKFFKEDTERRLKDVEKRCEAVAMAMATGYTIETRRLSEQNNSLKNKIAELENSIAEKERLYADSKAALLRQFEEWQKEKAT